MEGGAKMLVRWQGGPWQSDGPSIFCADRNTAVRGAEVHILPLHFPLKKAGYVLEAHGDFGTELFNLDLLIGKMTYQVITALAAGWRWRKRAMPVARKAFNIISNYRDYAAGFASKGACGLEGNGLADGKCV